MDARHLIVALALAAVFSGVFGAVLAVIATITVRVAYLIGSAPRSPS
jgi:hypothetical protein